jgi:hypothetical protein
MFEHPDALKLSNASLFYLNKSNYDLRRIKQHIIGMESDLEVSTEDSIRLMQISVPNNKLNVVVIGD